MGIKGNGLVSWKHKEYFTREGKTEKLDEGTWITCIRFLINESKEEKEPKIQGVQAEMKMWWGISFLPLWQTKYSENSSNMYGCCISYCKPF
jgi:hypothetical protein